MGPLPASFAANLRAPSGRALAYGVGAASAFATGALACTALLYQSASEVLQQTVTADLAQIAAVAATSIDVERHAALTQPRLLNGAQYRELVAPLRRLRTAMPHVRYLYTLRMSAAGPRFVLDAAPPLDTDGDGIIDQSALGELYDAPDPALRRALERGVPTATEAPYTDRWGTFMSAYHPLRAPDGRLEGIVGVDVRVQDYVARVGRMSQARDVGIIVGLVFALAVGTAVFLGQRARERARDALAVSESRLRNVFELGVVGMAVLSPDRRILSANAALAQLVGCPASRLIDEPWSTFSVEPVPDGADGARSEARLMDADGNWVDVELAIKAVHRAHGELDHFVLLASDLRERNRTQRELSTSLMQSEAMVAAVARLASHPGMASGNVAAVARTLTALAPTVLDTERSSVWLIDDEYVRCVDSFHRGDDDHATGETVPRGEMGEELRILESIGYVDARDAPRDSRLGPAGAARARSAGTAGLLHVGVRSSGRLLGLVCFERGESHDWSAREIAFGCQLADQIALAVLNSEAGQAMSSLRAARDEAQAASRAKTQFLATMSHEIRTPMNGVIGFTELLLQSPLSAEQHEMVTTIRNSGEALLTIINDVLDLSKVEAGKLELESHAFALTPLVTTVAQVLRPKEGLVTLAVDLASDLPSYVRGDSTRLRQVLLNLLGNAHKFTERGQVTLRVRRAESDQVRFEVEDTGVGIPEDAQPRIFGQFMQADASTTRRFGGTGLGLAISRRLVELMGGTIGFRSTVGVGTTFWFTVPLPEDHASEEVAHASDDLIGHARVLVAEDNLTNQRLIRRMAERLGCRVHVVGDGQAAIHSCLADRFDLVLMDCQMPTVDGLDATRAIRRIEAETSRDRTPIVALTASAMTGDRDACLAAGMDDFLTKPLRLAELRALLLRTKLTSSALGVP